MKMNTLYAALSGAFLLGAATLAPAQMSNAPAGSAVTNPVKNPRSRPARSTAPRRIASNPTRRPPRKRASR